MSETDLDWKLGETGVGVYRGRWDFYCLARGVEKQSFQCYGRSNQGTAVYNLIPTPFEPKTTWREVVEECYRYDIELVLDPTWKKEESYPKGTWRKITVEDKIHKLLEDKET